MSLETRLSATDYPITSDPMQNFNTRIVSMMNDYDISMSEALEWDFEGFGNDVDRSEDEGMLEADFWYYLHQNKVPVEFRKWYCDVFTGAANDMVLDINNKTS